MSKEFKYYTLKDKTTGAGARVDFVHYNNATVTRYPANEVPATVKLYERKHVLAETTKAAYDKHVEEQEAAAAHAANVREQKKLAKQRKMASKLGVTLEEYQGKKEAKVEKNTEVAEETDGVKISAAAKKLAEENEIDLESIEGTGKDGAITKGDIQAAIDAKSQD